MSNKLFALALVGLSSGFALSSEASESVLDRRVPSMEDVAVSTLSHSTPYGCRNDGSDMHEAYSTQYKRDLVIGTFA